MTTTTAPRLKQRYATDVRTALMGQYVYSNPM